MRIFDDGVAGDQLLFLFGEVHGGRCSSSNHGPNFALCNARPAAIFAAPFQPSLYERRRRKTPQLPRHPPRRTRAGASVAKYDSLTSDYAKLAKLPGYRPGKAPKAVIEKKFKKEIREELEKQLLGDATREAIQTGEAARAARWRTSRTWSWPTTSR